MSVALTQVPSRFFKATLACWLLAAKEVNRSSDAPRPQKRNGPSTRRRTLPLVLLAIGLLHGCKRGRAEYNTEHALAAVLVVRAAEAQFFSDRGYYGDLSALGPKKANLIPQDVAEGGARGYLFELRLTPGGYEFTAQPVFFDSGGFASYFCDQTGVIRWTGGSRPTKFSPAVSDTR